MFCEYKEILGKVKKGVHSLFLLGIAMHRLFCVRTTVDKMLFIPVKI